MPEREAGQRLVDRLGAVLPAVAAMLSTAALLGAVVAVFLTWGLSEAAGSSRFLRIWVIASGIALPLGFVFGVPLLAVLRALRRPRPTLGPEAVTTDPEAERD